MSVANLLATEVNVDYAVEKERIKEFITQFSKYSHNAFNSVKSGGLEYPYLEALRCVTQGVSSEVVVSLDDVLSFDKTCALLERIEGNTERYGALFEEVMDSLLGDDMQQPDDYSDPLQVIIYQRRQHNLYSEESESVKFPASITRRYTLYFSPRENSKSLSVREIKASSIGRYITVRGIVSRVNDVRPLSVVVALSCDKCGYEIFQEVTSQTFNPINECPSDQCKKNQVKGRLYMQTRASKLIKFQEIRLQEQMDQVPIGNIPRSMKVHLLDSNVRRLNAGDTVYISGVFLPTPYTGFKALRAGLMTDTYLKAHDVKLHIQSYSELKFTPEIQERVESIARSKNVYERLAASIAPEIYSMDDVKKILLLLLVGGTPKNTYDSMRIRGDINVCLVGDPGVAKSQILKHICRISPKGVYTTGRGTSGVGLTSCVVRDHVTNEFVLEGGALVMADGGVACIDEFDKMDENDRTAIHEVMEQQTISISKAGITTTLNARTSILAAANPLCGRYNSRMGFLENVNLPVALLSRFDVTYLLLDTPSMANDLKLSQHVTYVHMHNSHPVNPDLELVDTDLMRHYIAKCKEINPTISQDVGDYITSIYLQLRCAVRSEELHTCTRTLLSIIRMSTALARLRWSHEVSFMDVDEAQRLLESGMESLNHRKAHKTQDPVSGIFDIIKKASRDSSGNLLQEISIQDIRERILAKGYLEEDLQQCLTVYQDLWMVTSNKKKLRWLAASG